MMKIAIIEAASYMLAYVSQSSNISLWSTYSIPMVIPTFRRASNTPRNRKQPLESDADQNICCSSAAGEVEGRICEDVRTTMGWTPVSCLERLAY